MRHRPRKTESVFIDDLDLGSLILAQGNIGSFDEDEDLVPSLELHFFDGASGNDRCHLTAGRFDDDFTQNLIGDDALDRTRQLIADALFHTVAFLRGSKHDLKTEDTSLNWSVTKFEGGAIL